MKNSQCCILFIFLHCMSGNLLSLKQKMIFQPVNMMWPFFFRVLVAVFIFPPFCSHFFAVIFDKDFSLAYTPVETVETALDVSLGRSNAVHLSAGIWCILVGCVDRFLVLPLAQAMFLLHLRHCLYLLWKNKATLWTFLIAAFFDCELYHHSCWW